jgi:hypothetical protein
LAFGFGRKKISWFWRGFIENLWFWRWYFGRKNRVFPLFESHLGKIHFVIDTMEIESLCLKAQTLEVDHEEEDDEIMYHELELLCELQTNGQ